MRWHIRYTFQLSNHKFIYSNLIRWRWLWVTWKNQDEKERNMLYMCIGSMMRDVFRMSHFVRLSLYESAFQMHSLFYFFFLLLIRVTHVSHSNISPSFFLSRWHFEWIIWGAKFNVCMCACCTFISNIKFNLDRKNSRWIYARKR